MRIAYLGGLLCLLACGDDAPSAPTPTPVGTSAPASPPPPTMLTITAALTDTVSGISLGTATAAIPSLPALVPFSTNGYHPRTAWVTSTFPAVDLIPDGEPFDLEFYRAFARGSADGVTPRPLVVLAQAPAMYLQTEGLSAPNIAALEYTARQAVPAFSGGRFALADWSSGTTARAEQPGWIVIELAKEDEGSWCGRAYVGARSGHIWMNTASRCRFGGEVLYPGILFHEIGHAMGFWHVDRPGCLMQPALRLTVSGPCSHEHIHAAIAYKRADGNMDLDVDRAPTSSVTRRQIVVD